MNIDAIIPARKGSKRIYHKNTLLIGGKPLIEYTLEAALSSKSIRSTYLFTDDKELIRKYKTNRSVNIISRPERLSQDDTSLKDSVLYAIKALLKKSPADIYAILPPVAPFRSAAHVDSVIEFAASLPKYDSIASAVSDRTSGGYRLNKAIWLIPTNKTNRLNDMLISSRSRMYMMDEFDGLAIETPYDVMIAEAVLDFQKERFSWDARGGYNVQRFYAHDDGLMNIRRNIFDAAAYERHFGRYKYFLPHIKRADEVLDIACGSGYGSEILAGKARSVHGVDTDGTTIEYARRNYAKPNVRFTTSTIEAFSPKKRYDKIISVETIEHLKDPASYLARANGWLKPGGTMWLTCPLSEQGMQETNNPFHIVNITYESLKSMMEKHFEKVDFFDLTGSAVFFVDTLNNKTRYIVARGIAGKRTKKI
ncbi:MAG: methyltransferase domain-containing protein [Candidatus Omnitrophica bacterium]|nr:methyltransferase domain-containing protein [Candidatus Omnitrophota bacterium]